MVLTDRQGAVVPTPLDAAGAPVLRLEQGAWSPPGHLTAAVALVVTDGVLLRDTDTPQPVRARLYVTRSVLTGTELTDAIATWRALTPVELAVIDQEVLDRARANAPLHDALMSLITAGLDERDELNRIALMSRVEDRIAALLTHLAATVGEPRGDDIRLLLPVTHQTLGRIVGAQRPTASLAIGQLAREGRITRSRDEWLLATRTGAKRTT